MSIGIHFDTAPERTITPSDLYVSKSTTNNNLSYLLTAIIPNPDMEWLGGMSGILSIDLPKEERSQNLWLPLTAICHRPQKEIMYGWLKETRLTPFPSNSVSKEITR